MALTPEQVETRARELHEQSHAERGRLDDVRRYWKGRQRLPAVIPASAPAEVRILARMSRVNVIDLVVESMAQSLSVEGYRATDSTEDTDVWAVWQANKLDARQDVIHRACLAYGVSYAVVTPGDSVPVIRGVSPRKLTTLYEADEPDWPAYALEQVPSGPWRLYDAANVYLVRYDGSGKFEHIESKRHEAGVTPVVRYLEVQDPDWDDEPTDESLSAERYSGERQVIGQVAGLMTLQDQIDLITFDLFVAMHYASFRQRAIIGWMAPDEQTKMKMGASSVWTFEDAPDQVKIVDLEATQLNGYLESRESSFRQVAAMSQTPTHELTGDLVNLSAEALAAAESGRDRKVAARQKTIGEAHEQTLKLAAALGGQQVPDDAQVRWRDTSARSFASVVDALVKLIGVGLPIEEALERVPDMSQQDVERIRAAIRKRTAPPAGDAPDTGGVTT